MSIHLPVNLQPEKHERHDNALLASVLMGDDMFFPSCLLLPPQFTPKEGLLRAAST
jgi:hypothetical protein